MASVFGRQLRIAAGMSSPWVFNDNNTVGGITGTLWKEIAAYYNWSYSVQTDPFNHWGVIVDDNLTFNGMVGMLQRDETDIGIGPFYIHTQRRFLVTDPSFVFAEEGGAILSGFDFTTSLAKRKDNLNGLMTLAQPFEMINWICLFASVFVFGAMFTFRNQLISQNSILCLALLKDFFNNLGSLAATLLGQPMISGRIRTKNPVLRQRTIEERYLGFSKPERQLLNWFWACVVLTLPAFYSSYIFAKIVSRPVFVVETLDDIARLPKIEIAFWKASAFGCNVACPKIANDIPFLGFQMSSGEKTVLDLPKNILNSKESYDGVLDGNRIIFEQTSILFETLSKRIKNHERCGFYLSGNTYYTYMLSMLFNKNLNVKIRKVVNRKILQFTESGLFGQIRSKFEPKNYENCLISPKSKDFKNAFKKIAFSDLRGIVLFLLGIQLLALFLSLKRLLKKFVSFYN